MQLPIRLLIPLPRLKCHNQRVLDRKYRVVLEVFAVLVKDLRDNWFVALTDGLFGTISTIFADSFCPREWYVMGRRKNKDTYKNMDVSRAERMTIHHPQKFTSWAIVGHGVRSWS